VAKDELRDVVAKLEALDVIEAKVLSGEDAAEAGLRRYVAVAVKGPHGARQGARRDLDAVAVAEDGAQHGRAGGADGAVGAGIRRIGGGVSERGPVRVGDGGGVPIRVREADRRDRPPELEVIFRVVHRDGAIGEREVENGEQPGGALQVGVVCEGRVLGDDVPGVPDWWSPEFADDGLVGGPRRAG